MKVKMLSPVGRTVSETIERNRRDSAEFRAEYERLAGFEELARIVIMRRAELGLSQDELARRMGTTAPVISRIESGQHAMSSSTLQRLAPVLDMPRGTTTAG